MAKTVRLLSTYNGNKPQSIITLDDSIADQLIAGWNATLDLTGGTPSYTNAPAAPFPDAQTIKAGQTVTLTVPAGVVLSLNGSVGIVGTREVLNPDGSVASSQALSTGDTTIGVFQLDTRVRFNVAYGTLSVKSGATLGANPETPLSARIENLQAGDDEVHDWKLQAPAGIQGHDIDPLETPVGPMPYAEALGTSGGQGDLLQTINTFPKTNPPVNAAVYLLLDDAPDILYGTAGAVTADGDTTLNLTAPTTITNTAARAFAGCILWYDQVPTGAGVKVRFFREITGHVGASGTSFAPVVTHGVPAGAAITEWGVRPKKSARQIAKHNDGPREIALHRQSTGDGFVIAVDRQVSVMTGGQYT